MRAFVQLREAVTGNKQINEKLAWIERKLASHDQEIHVLIAAIRQLMAAQALPKERQGNCQFLVCPQISVIGISMRINQSASL